MQEHLKEDLLKAWVGLTSILRNNRMTQTLTYNEAIVMMYTYERYCENKDEKISFKEITEKTRMLKSLVNRTVNSLEEKGFITKTRGKDDSRTIYISILDTQLDKFLNIHNASLSVAESILKIIGTEDAEAFVRIYKKIAANYGN